MKLTPQMVDRLRQYMVQNGMSTYDLGSQLKIQSSTIARILRGETTSLQKHTWSLLEPIIGSPTPSLELREEPPHYASNNSPGQFGPALSPVRAIQTSKQPVIGIAQAAGWVPALQPLGDFLSEFGDSVAWEEVEEGCWLLRVEGISMQPLLANGAILHVDTRRFPRRGEMVVARIASEEYPVVKYYDRRDGIVYLLRLNDEAEQRSYRINTKSNEDHILWMYPVTEFRSKPPTRLATSEDY